MSLASKSVSIIGMNWQQRLPNQLTLFRILLAIPITAFMFRADLLWGIAAASLFVIASITDYFDGYFARKYKVVSSLGQFMDPIADKILVSSSLIMLLYIDRVGPLMVILLLSRDLIIGGIRSAAAADNLIIAARNFGKWKTGVQMVCIPTLMVNIELFGLPLPDLARIGLWTSVVLSTVSGVQYVRAFLKARKT